jgi:hypothetical protein
MVMSTVTTTVTMTVMMTVTTTVTADESLPSATTQHGYKAGHSTTTAMLLIVTTMEW